MASVGVAVAIFGSERTDTPWLFVTLVLFEGWAWIAAGLVALARRPDTPAGLWMIAAGFSWMWGALEFANPDVLETLGAAFAGTLFPFILHVLVGFPTSVRLTGAARALLVVAWGTWIVTALTFALWPLGRDGCETCSREVFPVAPGTPGSEVLSVLGNGVGALFVAAAVLVAARRHRALLDVAPALGDPVSARGPVGPGACMRGALAEGLRRALPCADPSNLLWVMPASEPHARRPVRLGPNQPRRSPRSATRAAAGARARGGAGAWSAGRCWTLGDGPGARARDRRGDRASNAWVEARVKHLWGVRRPRGRQLKRTTRARLYNRVVARRQRLQGEETGIFADDHVAARTAHASPKSSVRRLRPAGCVL